MFSLDVSTVTIKDKAIFSRQLAAALDAGMPASRCLALLTRECPNPKLKKALTKMSADIQQGANFSEAMGKYPWCFDALYVALVRAGESGGVLPQVLNYLATLMEESAWRQSKIDSALFYLKFVGKLAIAILIAIIVFAPDFAKIFAEKNIALPFLMRVVVDNADFLNVYSFVMLMVLELAVIVAKNDPDYEGLRIDRFKLKLPIVGDMIKKAAAARFCWILGILMGAGVAILSAWEMAQDAVGETEAIALRLPSAKNDIKQGSRISAALQKQQVFPARIISAIATAEEAGKTDEQLIKVSDLYENEVEGMIKLMTVLSGIILGGIVAL